MLLIVLIAACKMDDTGPTTGDLSDKSLPVIKASIEGTWKLIYGKGGFASNSINYYDSAYWEFHFQDGDRIIQNLEGDIWTDTTISWHKGAKYYPNDTYIMSFFDKINEPYSYYVKGIFDDTLVIQDAHPDAVSYHMTRR